MLTDADIQLHADKIRDDGYTVIERAAVPGTAKRTRAEDIEAVTVHTYWFTWSEIGSGPEKWHPTTRESADHSLPYILGAVLIDGRFSDDIFSQSRIRDARIRRRQGARFDGRL